MDRVWKAVTRVAGVLLVVSALVVAGVAVGIVPIPVFSSYEHATVTVVDQDGTERGIVRVRVADTFSQRYRGLSDTESLAPDEGMLFVFDREANRTFVMREMRFPLDIIFIGADRRITTIAHAPVPAPGRSERELTRYRGRAKWVLEVNRNWTHAHGVTVGDRVVIQA